MYYFFHQNAIDCGMQAAFEKRLAEGEGAGKTDDRRIGFPFALAKIGKIRQDWWDRLEDHLNEILAKNPYMDGPWPKE